MSIDLGLLSTSFLWNKNDSFLVYLFDFALYGCRVTLWERLKAMGVTPYKDKNPDFSAERPVGHSTHNLFVKDKKKKKHFLIMGRQNAEINLKVRKPTSRLVMTYFVS